MTKRLWILLVVIAVVAAGAIAVVVSNDGSDKKFVAPKPTTSVAPRASSISTDLSVR